MFSWFHPNAKTVPRCQRDVHDDGIECDHGFVETRGLELCFIPFQLKYSRVHNQGNHVSEVYSR